MGSSVLVRGARGPSCRDGIWQGQSAGAVHPPW